MFIASILTKTQLLDFISSNLLFLVCLVMSMILFIITAGLAMGGLSERWKRRCGTALIFTISPVIVWVIYFFKPVFSPHDTSLIAWGVLGVLYILSSIINSIRKKFALKKENCWLCRACKTVNQNIFLSCQNCKQPRHR